MSDQTPTHAAIQELSGAAALRALTPDEARFVASHLAACAECRAEYRELAQTADLLLRLPDPIAPSAGLRARILAAAESTPQERPAEPGAAAGGPRASTAPVDRPPLEPAGDAAVGAAAPMRPPVPIARRRRFDPRDLGLVASLAAALFFGFWTLRLQGQVAELAERTSQQQVIVDAAASGRVVRLAATGPAPQVRGVAAEGPGGTVVYLDDLPNLPADRTYQVWLIPPGGQPIGAGLSTPGQGGTQTIQLDRPLTGIETVAVTVEPAGGSPGPTSAPIVAGQL